VVAAVTGAVAVDPAPAQAAAGPVVVSLTFDDGLTSQYQLAPILAAHGVHATFYLNTGLVPANPAGRMTRANARELAAAGHEIGGHTLSHVNIGDSTVPLEERRRQVCEDRANLLAQGFSATSFAYATGGTDPTAEAIVEECGYKFAREAGGLLPTGPAYAETVPPIDGAYEVRALGGDYNGPVTFEALRTAAEAAYDNGGGWLPMLFHRVCYQGTAAYTECMGTYRPVDAAVIDRFLTWVDGHAGISARSMTEVFHDGVTAPPPPVISRPELTRVSRTVLGQGAEKAVVELTGTFDPTSKVSVSGWGVLARVISRSASSIELGVSVRSDAPVGARTVTVLNQDGGRVSCGSCLRVAQKPRISMLRGTAPRDRVSWVTIRGSGFTDRVVVTVGGKGVRVRSVRVLSPRRMRFAVRVDRGARRTARSLTVTDRATLGTDTLARSLKVR
jgi:peptidoglycan/xylan/chitin deacetylase (PgdA/CDA1 family)